MFNLFSNCIKAKHLRTSECVFGLDWGKIKSLCRQFAYTAVWFPNKNCCYCLYRKCSHSRYELTFNESWLCSLRAGWLVSICHLRQGSFAYTCIVCARAQIGCPDLVSPDVKFCAASVCTTILCYVIVQSSKFFCCYW